ncbi:MAG: hypothetical protein PWR20_2094 [Bacteroidales bacterium]|jgi:hypothetical protein|nr:hypothetical protein [Bacteroidales bacterium]MDN5329278.1 hypothetical protein [Bacteroidales bacterium]
MGLCITAAPQTGNSAVKSSFVFLSNLVQVDSLILLNRQLRQAAIPLAQPQRIADSVKRYEHTDVKTAHAKGHLLTQEQKFQKPKESFFQPREKTTVNY